MLAMFSISRSLARAWLGGLDSDFRVLSDGERRSYFIGHPVRDANATMRGIVVVHVDLDRIELQWRGVEPALFFTDANGVVLVSNKDAVTFLSLRDGLTGTSVAQRYGGVALDPIPLSSALPILGVPTWRGLDLPGLPETAVHLVQDLPTIGLTAHILADFDHGWRIAALYGTFAAAIGGFLCLIAAFYQHRRATLAQQLASEEAASQALAATVADRTSELQSTNFRLETEVAERTAAEAELRSVHDQLVQAGKMKALGEMSAGISHELNQPLAAIQSLADNAEVLLEREKPAEVQKIVQKIAATAGRAGRIIRNLRAFARNDPEEARDVNLASVVEDAIGMAAGRADAADVTIDWQPPDLPIFVSGGPVRLQQVTLNLIANAVDAMLGQDRPGRVVIRIEGDDGRARLLVRDTGPGLDDEGRVFDPFYTTKPVGEGLGLGLSISYGIVQSFGGTISGANHPESGAVFTVDLPRVSTERAA